MSKTDSLELPLEVRNKISHLITRVILNFLMRKRSDAMKNAKFIYTEEANDLLKEFEEANYEKLPDEKEFIDSTTADAKGFAEKCSYLDAPRKKVVTRDHMEVGLAITQGIFDIINANEEKLYE